MARKKKDKAPAKKASRSRSRSRSQSRPRSRSDSRSPALPSELSPLNLKATSLLETQSRFIGYLLSQTEQDFPLSDEDENVLGSVLSQCQTLLSAATKVLEASRMQKAAKSDDSAVADKVQAAIEYTFKLVDAHDSRCDSYHKMKGVIVDQIGAATWEMHRSRIVAAIKARVSSLIDPSKRRSEAGLTSQAAHSRSMPSLTANSQGGALSKHKHARVSTSVPSFSKTKSHAAKNANRRVRSHSGATFRSVHAAPRSEDPAKQMKLSTLVETSPDPGASRKNLRRHTAGGDDLSVPRKHLFRSTREPVRSMCAASRRCQSVLLSYVPAPLWLSCCPRLG